MSLGLYLLKRSLIGLLLVFLVASAAVILTHLAPGDFTFEDQSLSREEREQRRRELGLDRPLMEQYITWLAKAVRFDFGESLLYRRPVNELLGARTLNTAVLATSALMLATLLGLPLGIYSASRPRGLAARLIATVSVLFLSVPPLVAALGLVVIAAGTGWLPVGGMRSLHSSDLGPFAYVLDLMIHLPLPALALALPFAATLERLQAQALTQTFDESFVRAALARGVSRWRAILRHAWPVSLRPVLGLYGLMIGSLFSGSFIVEVVTAWPGLGRLMFDALRARDIFLVAGTAAAGAAILAAGTLVADALLAIADPRVIAGHRS